MPGFQGCFHYLFFSDVAEYLACMALLFFFVKVYFPGCRSSAQHMRHGHFTSRHQISGFNESML